MTGNSAAGPFIWDMEQINMIGVIIVFGIIFAILLGAGRIILGWLLPSPTMVKFDRFIGKVAKLYLQICVVALAVVIIFALWYGMKMPGNSG
jgi:hypothetical protein